MLLAKYIVAHGERVDWVIEPREIIQKAILNYVAKFFQLFVRNKVSPTQVCNILKWARVLMVESLVAELGIGSTWFMLEEVHEKAFKTTTAYHISCQIFQMCIDAEVPIGNYDTSLNRPGRFILDLIKNEANVATPLEIFLKDKLQ